MTHRVSANLAASESTALSQICLDGSDCYWLQSQPERAGRLALMRQNKDGIADILPDQYSVKSKVHEYGGGAYIASCGQVYFCNETDQRIYHFDTAGGQLKPVSEKNHHFRYADMVVDTNRNRIITVREDTSPSLKEPQATLVAINLASPHNTEILVEGADFYSSPGLNHDASKICWISWQHPHMPWDSSRLWKADLTQDGQLNNPECIAGSERESVMQPRWCDADRLFFISDRNNWWNIYFYDQNRIQPVLLQPHDFAKPPWIFGLSTYALLSPELIISCYTNDASWQLSLISLVDGNQTPIETGYSQISAVQANDQTAVFIASSETTPQSIATFNISNGKTEPLTHHSTALLPAQITRAQAITYTGAREDEVHALYYKPEFNVELKPPLLVIAHGGPTSQFETVLDLKIQYWTSRGYAVLTVNYTGSSGYGRAYRENLRGLWGVADVEDCIAGAKYLIDINEVDANRVAIRGSSAGGFSVLCALTFHRFFSAGVSYYGISDLERLHQATHKFESRYVEQLIGKYPQQKSLYQSRSPLFHSEALNCPVLFFQGMRDKIVPPDQAEGMCDALRNNQIKSELVKFDDEGHGFRNAKNIAQCLEKELAFYRSVFGA